LEKATTERTLMIKLHIELTPAQIAGLIRIATLVALALLH
jgi:hypothetical protein